MTGGNKLQGVSQTISRFLLGTESSVVGSSFRLRHNIFGV